MTENRKGRRRSGAREKLLEAARKIVREKGYAATTVDELCKEAGVTKGAFFHHFASKTELAVAAADFWGETTSALFADAPYHEPADPLDRVLAYVDFRKALLTGEIAEMTCLVGTMTQEVYGTAPEIREACRRSIMEHAETLVDDIRAAARHARVEPPHGAESLARHTQAVIQGAFILAKAADDPAVAAESLDHLRRYLDLLLDPRTRKEIAP